MYTECEPLFRLRAVGGFTRSWADGVSLRDFADAVSKHPHNDMSSDLFRNSVRFIYTFADICRK